MKTNVFIIALLFNYENETSSTLLGSEVQAYMLNVFALKMFYLLGSSGTCP